MKSASQAMSEPAGPSTTRASSVLMGRQDYLSVLLRLIGMELYKLRRRMMSKVLIIISIAATIGLFALIALIAFFMAKDGVPLETIRNFTGTLRLPTSLLLIEELLLYMGQILIIILVSTITGGEYASGTVRLMLTRGPTRTQILLSKIGAAICCIVLGVVGVSLLGVLTGLLFNLTTGIVPSFAFFSAAWLGHALLYLLIIMLDLFMYAMMALFLSTLGRATAAGLAGALTWSLVIEPVIELIGSLGRNISGPTGSFFQSLPDYLIGPNISRLLQNQSLYIFPSPGGLEISLSSNVHALLVLAAYLVVFIGISRWVIIRRDVTN